MGRTSKIDPATAYPLWMSGSPLAEISRTLGVHRMALTSYAQRHGWPKREQLPERAALAWDKAKARALYDEGYSLAAIAEALGIPRQTVRSYASYHHWPRRFRVMRGVSVVAPVQPDLPVVTAVDSDIERYRIEKVRKEQRDEAQLADARRLFLVLEAAAKPKRGRPKKNVVVHMEDAA